MDRSLDEIIGERPSRGPRGGRRGDGRRPQQTRAPPRRDENPRDGVRKPRRDGPNLDRDWVHDRWEDDRYEHQRRDADRHDDFPRAPAAPVSRAQSSLGTKIRVENLHHDLLQSDIEDLFQRIGPTSAVEVIYDRADRSTGTAFVTYHDSRDAYRAVEAYDGQYANRQIIRLSIVPNAPTHRSGAGLSLLDRMERPRRSLIDRIEDGVRDGEYSAPRRRQRSDSPRRSDVRGPPPENIDRYVPGQPSRSPVRRRGTPRGGRAGGRRPGERTERRAQTDTDGHRMVGGRPRKTAEELDAEMADYWTNTESGNNATNGEQAQNGGATMEEDVDMVT